MVEHYFNETVNLVVHSKCDGQSTPVPQACLRTQTKQRKMSVTWR